MKVVLGGDLWHNALIDIENALEFRQKSLLIANLETPVVQHTEVKRQKAGPHIKGDKAVDIKYKDFFCVDEVCLNLSNNHSMDFGLKGLEETIDYCASQGVSTFGADVNSRSARQPLIVERDGITIGIFGRCEKQFGSAFNKRGGVATVDPTIYERIRQLEQKVDLVIVSLHGGSELSPWPFPAWRDRCRALVDAGASVVHGHHAHIPQGYESYRQGLIFYGLGNLLTPPGRWKDTPNALWSILPVLTIESGKITSWALRTTVIDDSNDQTLLRDATENEWEAHKRYLSTCNEPLAEPERLDALWQEVSVRLYQQTYKNWLDFRHKKNSKKSITGLLFRIGRRLLDWINSTRQGEKRFLGVNDWRKRLWFHLFACESHREAISYALGVLCGEYNDLRSDETKEAVDKMMPWTKNYG
ncbi:poly-gamma-glutamate synthesis protein (capsule biosynthesis protein) [Salinibacter ruber]|uniref:CapA family protein n=1 Tax=Salinibacter ruber TaxID=146919 RepID=UPI002169C3BA|nr:poly-gamma-glutamate synthesis protein (capsule biosynthesis protein) [Salinibacter ruber]